MKLGTKKFPEEVLLSPYSLFTDISRMIDGKMNACCEKLKLQSGARRVLSCLNKNSELSQLDLVRATHLKAPTISLIVQKMEQDGLICRRTDDIDMRLMRVSMTELGENREKQVSACAQEIEETALAGFTDEEKKTLTSLLSRVYANLDDSTTR